jgi:tetratricopeptide (TPR) repeat protein
MKYKFLLFLLFPILTASDSSADPKLFEADSLFRSKKYTESKSIFNEITATGKASPALLLKMAYIDEGLGDYVQALFHLNSYYSMTSNEQALDKMRNIAEKMDLMGYEYSDYGFFRNLLTEFKIEIEMSLCSILLLLSFLSFRKKQAMKAFRPIIYIQIGLIFILGLSVNDLFEYDRAIINSDNVILMSAPSAGAEPVEIIEKGHLIEVLSRHDTWVKILWYDQEVFIKTQKLLFI